MALRLWMSYEEEVDRLRALPIEEVCHYLAMKVRRYRQEVSISQVDFAREAGIPLRTYKRFEAHGQASLETFVQVLRAMDRTRYLFMLFPAPTPLRREQPLEEKLEAIRL